MAAPVTPENILSSLHEVWRSLADAANVGERRHVIRACAMTLTVLAGESDNTTEIALTLSAVMREHPHRAIIVQVRRDAPLDYRVSAQCRMPDGERQQICCEQIEIDAPEESFRDLEPVLLAIRAPDLPSVIWCRSAALAGVPRTLFAGSKVIVDSTAFAGPAAAFEFLAAGPCRADLAWTRVTRWREIVAQIFADPGRRDLLPGLRSLRIRYIGTEPPATVFYFAGWIAACLARDDLEVQYEAGAGAGGGFEGFELSGGGHSVSARRVDGSAVLIEVDALKSCAACARLTEAELLAGELAITGRDAVFEKTLPYARRFAAEASK
jgi:glucose-6-phosphate dehydrogenase assembly protein OpcA